MSSSTTTSITLPKHKSSKKPDNKSKQKHKLFERNTASPSSLLPKGGPPENEFFQFYSELYKSAVLFSNPKFQQMLLFPHPSQAHSLINTSRSLSSPNSMMMMKNKRAMKKAQRRLSGGSAQQRQQSPNSNITYRTSSTSTSTMSTCDGDYNSAESGGSLTKKSFSDHFLVHHPPTIAPLTSTPTQTGKTKVIGGLKLKRRVSFSKNSPRARSRSNSQQQQYNKQGSSTNNNVPWITIQEHCWSSDMDETDTTEDSDEEDATSSSVLLYVGSGGKKECGSATCDRDGDNENSTTDDGTNNLNLTHFNPRNNT